MYFCKNGLSHITLKKHRFYVNFGIIFRPFWHHFPSLFRHRFLHRFLTSFWTRFDAKRLQNGSQNRPQNAPKTHPKKHRKNGADLQPEGRVRSAPPRAPPPNYPHFIDKSIPSKLKFKLRIPSTSARITRAFRNLAPSLFLSSIHRFL